MKGIRPLQLCFPGYNQAALAQVDPLASKCPLSTTQAVLKPLLRLSHSQQICKCAELGVCVQILSLASPEGADIQDFHRFITSIILPFFSRSSSRVEELQVRLSLPNIWPLEKGFTMGTSSCGMLYLRRRGLRPFAAHNTIQSHM